MSRRFYGEFGDLIRVCCRRLALLLILDMVKMGLAFHQGTWHITKIFRIDWIIRNSRIQPGLKS